MTTMRRFLPQFEADCEQIFSFCGRVATDERVTMSSTLLEAMTTVASLYPYFKPTSDEIQEIYKSTADEVGDDWEDKEEESDDAE